MPCMLDMFHSLHDVSHSFRVTSAASKISGEGCPLPKQFHTQYFPLLSFDSHLSSCSFPCHNCWVHVLRANRWWHIYSMIVYACVYQCMYSMRVCAWLCVRMLCVHVPKNGCVCVCLAHPLVCVCIHKWVRGILESMCECECVNETWLAIFNLLHYTCVL